MSLLVASLVSSVPNWLAAVGILGAAVLFYRGGGSTAIQSLETANRVLERRVHVLENQRKADAQTIATQSATIAKLQAQTNIATALEPVLTWTHLHEERDQERFEKTLLVLDQIARRLGPDIEVGSE